MTRAQWRQFDAEEKRSIEEFVNRMEHPEELDWNPHHLLASTDFDLKPYRHPDRLRHAWQLADSVTETSRVLESSVEAVSRWLHIYGFRERPNQSNLADRLEAMEPDEIGGAWP